MENKKKGTNISKRNVDTPVFSIGYWYPPSEPQLSGTLQVECPVCNDIRTSEHVLSTKLEGYFGVLSIWAVQ